MSTVSSFCMLLSTIISASRTSGLYTIVALLNTDTLASGKKRLRKSIVSSMIALKSGCAVGSPLPANVITSNGSWLPCRCCSTFANSTFTSSLVGRFSLGRKSALKPHSQYRQSKVHILPSAGIRFTPSDTPSRRECIGPNIGDGYITVDIRLVSFIQLYSFL